MRSKSSALAICFAVTMAGYAAHAQLTAAAHIALAQEDAGIVLSQPCTVVEQTQSTRQLPDGTTLTRRTEVRKWRDSQGRFRKQTAEVADGQEPQFETVSIIDPVASTLTILYSDRKTAIVYHLPDHGPNSLHPYVELDDIPLLARPGVKINVEKLEPKTIAGVYAVGRRVTRVRPPGVIGNDKTVTSVAERWISPDLKILLASSSDDPREQLIRQVTQLDRSEPDPSIFQIPQGFTVKEVPVQQKEQ
jgi:hypothetical protein